MNKKMKEQKELVTSNWYLVTAYKCLFDIEPDELRTGKQGGRDVTVAVYSDKDELPNPTKFMVVYESGEAKKCPLLTVAYSDEVVFETMFYTIKKMFFERLDREKENAEE